MPRLLQKPDTSRRRKPPGDRLTFRKPNELKSPINLSEVFMCITAGIGFKRLGIQGFRFWGSLELHAGAMLALRAECCKALWARHPFAKLLHIRYTKTFSGSAHVIVCGFHPIIDGEAQVPRKAASFWGVGRKIDP